jgi:hypothetical protein
MILPDNCEGNLLLLLNLLFCDDHRTARLNPTPSKSAFCAERVFRSLGITDPSAETPPSTMIDPNNFFAMVPGAYKEVIRYFIDIKNAERVRRAKAFIKNVFDRKPLPPDNPAVLEAVNLSKPKTLQELQNFHRYKRIKVPVPY